MFWTEIGHGLSVLTHWETYAAILEYLAIVLIPRVFFGWVLLRNEGSPAATTLGCFVMPVVLTIFQVLAVFTLICTLGPLVLGRPEGAMWAFPWAFLAQEPLAATKIMGLMFAVGFFVSIFRLELLVNPVMGCALMAFIATMLGGVMPLWPGFLFFVGVLIVTGLLYWLALIIVAAIASKFDDAGTAAGTLIVQPMAAVFLFLPVFIYGGWLTLHGHT